MNSIEDSSSPVNACLLMPHLDEASSLLADPTPWPDAEVNAEMEAMYDEQAMTAADNITRREGEAVRTQLRQAMPAGSAVDASRMIGVEELNAKDYAVDRCILKGYYKGEILASGNGKTWGEALADALKDMAERREKAIAKAAAMTGNAPAVALVA